MARVRFFEYGRMVSLLDFLNADGQMKKPTFGSDLNMHDLNLFASLWIVTVELGFHYRQPNL
jgi:hypothetical protein